MASQGTKLTVKPYTGPPRDCTFRARGSKCGGQAVNSLVCSPNFLELIIEYACEDCTKKCQECAAKNKPVKSALDY